MVAQNSRAYTRRDLVWAVNVSAVLGWAVVTALSLYSSDLSILQQRVALVPWAALYGLPIALLACWLIGAPILWRLMRRSITWLSAAGWGSLIGALIYTVWLAVERVQGWAIANNPSSHNQVGGGEFLQQLDGVLTSYGWWVKAQEAFICVLIGGAVALILRWVIGPGKVSTSPP